MQRRLCDDVDLIERKARRVFAFSGDDYRGNALKRRDLPVDVQHLRFQKRRAIAGDDRTSCQDRKSTRLNSSHVSISYAVFCLKKKNGAWSHCRAAMAD